MSAIVRKEFGVDGMSCGGCAGSVTRAVSQLPGVRKVNVSVTDKSAIVEYDDAAVDAATIVAAIEGAGFEAAAR